MQTVQVIYQSNLKFFYCIRINFFILNIGGIKSRVIKLLNLRNIEKSKIVQIIREYEDNLGEEHVKSDESQEEHERIKDLIVKF